MKYINLLIKPASSLCNLRCKYCFYEDEANKRSEKSMGIMTENTVDQLLLSVFTSIDKNGTVSFNFQGGEPTVAGLKYFEFFVEKARKNCPKGVTLSFSIQTNGTLLDEDFVSFFKKEKFLVGISVDGFEFLHDMYRVDSFGEGSYKKVLYGIELLKKYQVDMNALCVVTGKLAKKPEKVYHELKKLGFQFIQFIACMDPIGEVRGDMPYSLSPDSYGKFLCSIFDCWYTDWKKGQYHSVRLLDDYVHILLSDSSSTCSTCGKCSSYFVIESDGSVYPCDFYSLDEWKMGNIHEMSLESMLESDAKYKFLKMSDEKPEECKTCPFKMICNGGCKNDWIIKNGKSHNYYCESFKALLKYGESGFMEIVNAEREFQRRMY